MGKYDKDRFLKELAVRYCLAKRVIPFLEVNVTSISDISDSIDLLTDIDVLGVENIGDGGLRKTLFDCKTSNKMSSINRAFWAAGVKAYANCDEAYVILKSRAVRNHRISALSLGVDLHDEASFKDLGKTQDPAFPLDSCYQASLDRWNAVYETYERNNWSANLYDLARNATPLTSTPGSVFRRIIAEFRNIRGRIDPAKDGHITIHFDVLSSLFVLWADLARDIRRFYDPTMSKEDFEKTLRYYLWGGKESYRIRQQLHERARENSNGASVEFPAWEALQSFAGLILSAPQVMLECADLCREVSIRTAVGNLIDFDAALANRVKSNSRLRQFTAALSDYVVAAGSLPKDLAKRSQEILFAL
jgi:hypothetical protein